MKAADDEVNVIGNIGTVATVLRCLAVNFLFVLVRLHMDVVACSKYQTD